MELAPDIRQKLLLYQKIEITEHHIYRNLAKTARPAENRHVLERIAEDELRLDWSHPGADFWP